MEANSHYVKLMHLKQQLADGSMKAEEFMTKRCRIKVLPETRPEFTLGHSLLQLSLSFCYNFNSCILRKPSRQNMDDFASGVVLDATTKLARMINLSEVHHIGIVDFSKQLAR